MSLIQNELSKEQKSERTRAEIEKLLLTGCDELYLRSKFIFDLVWDNKHGLTPQEVFDSFGTEALSFAKLFGLTEKLVKMIDDRWNLVRPLEIIPQDDGSIKVQET